MKEFLKNAILIVLGATIALIFSPGLKTDQIDLYTGDASGTSEFTTTAPFNGTVSYSVSYKTRPGVDIAANLLIKINGVSIDDCNGNANGNALIPNDQKIFTCGSYTVSKGDKIAERHFVNGAAEAQLVERRFRYSTLVCNTMKLFC